MKQSPKNSRLSNNANLIRYRSLILHFGVKHFPFTFESYYIISIHGGLLAVIAEGVVAKFKHKQLKCSEACLQLFKITLDMPLQLLSAYLSQQPNIYPPFVSSPHHPSPMPTGSSCASHFLVRGKIQLIFENRTPLINATGLPLMTSVCPSCWVRLGEMML